MTPSFINTSRYIVKPSEYWYRPRTGYSTLHLNLEASLPFALFCTSEQNTKSVSAFVWEKSMKHLFYLPRNKKYPEYSYNVSVEIDCPFDISDVFPVELACKKWTPHITLYIQDKQQKLFHGNSWVCKFIPFYQMPHVYVFSVWYLIS